MLIPAKARAIAAAGCVAAVGIASCSNPDPLGGESHDVVAQTLGITLTPGQVAGMLANAKVRVPMTKENGMIVVGVWSTYHKLAYAAAQNDTLLSHIDAAMTPAANTERVAKFLLSLRDKLPTDTATQAAYDTAAYGLYGARHISFPYPPKATQRQKDSIYGAATVVRKSVNAANFTAMADKYNADKQSGFLGVFPRSYLNPVVLPLFVVLKPDSITRAIQTQLSAEIVQRLSWADARAAFIPQFNAAVNRAKDSTNGATLAAAAHLTLTKDAPAIARATAANPIKGLRDTSTLATFDGGRFTAGDMVGWVNYMAPAQRTQVLRDLPQQADTITQQFVYNLAIRGVLLRAADAAKVAVADTLRTSFHDQFVKDVVRTWHALGVAPDQLADSAKTPQDRLLLAARRVDRVLERAMVEGVNFAAVSVPLETAVDAKYETKFSDAGLARALELAGQARAETEAIAKDKAERTLPGDTAPVQPKPASKKP